MDIREKTIVVGVVSITAREKLGKDVFNWQKIAVRLGLDTVQDDNYMRSRFCHFICQTIEVTNLPFAWPTVNASEVELRAAYEYWQNLKADIVQAWENLLEELDRPTNDIVLLPKAQGE
jgi:hypothetical protein